MNLNLINYKLNLLLNYFKIPYFDTAPDLEGKELEPNASAEAKQFYNANGYGPYTNYGGRKLKEVEDYKDKIRASGDSIAIKIVNDYPENIVWIQKDTPAKNKVQVIANQRRMYRVERLSPLQEMHGVYFNKKTGKQIYNRNLTAAEHESNEWHPVQRRIKYMVANHLVVADNNNTWLHSKHYDEFVSSIPGMAISDIEYKIKRAKEKAKYKV